MLSGGSMSLLFPGEYRIINRILNCLDRCKNKKGEEKK